MKFSFNMSGHRRANVWLDEEPPTAYRASSVESKIVKPRTLIEAKRRIAAVEVIIAHGARSSYAFLGAELLKADLEGLEVVVSVNKAGAPFAASLAGKLDEVRIGLPDEYAKAVVSGAVKIAEAVGTPMSRKLWFRWAAHGFVSSSPAIFEQVSGTVLQLLTLSSAADDQIRALIEQ